MLLCVPANGVVVGLAPSNAEGVARRVGKHCEALIYTDVAAYVELDGTELQGPGADVLSVLNMQVEMHLLRIAIRPYRRDVPRGALDPHDPAAVAVDDVVPVPVREHSPAEHRSPEGALGFEVCRIKHHDLPDQIHR